MRGAHEVAYFHTLRKPLVQRVVLKHDLKALKVELHKNAVIAIIVIRNNRFFFKKEGKCVCSAFFVFVYIYMCFNKKIKDSLSTRFLQGASRNFLT